MNNFVLGFLLGAALLSIIAPSRQSDVMTPIPRRQTILVGDTELGLGMSRADVMKAFSKNYVVRENKSKGVDWLIYAEKDDPNGPFLAGLAFSQGRLSVVIKPWLKGSTRGNIGAIEMGTAVYGILANFADAGETHCSLRVNHDDTPDHSSKVANVMCGQKSLSVALTAERGEGEVVDLQELLSNTVTNPH